MKILSNEYGYFLVIQNTLDYIFENNIITKINFIIFKMSNNITLINL